VTSTRLLALLLAILTLLGPAALTSAQSQNQENLQQLQQRMQTLTQEFLSCRDDACRIRVQADMVETGMKITALAAEMAAEHGGDSASDAAAPPATMSLPRAGAIDPNAGSWRVRLTANSHAAAPGVSSKHRLEGEILLYSDAKGVLTGSGPITAEIILSDPPHCRSEPMHGTGDLKLGGLRDGEFIWLWAVPGEPIQTTGTTSCAVMSQITTSETEESVAPAAEFRLTTPVMLTPQGDWRLHTSSDVHGLLGSGGLAGATGHWERIIKIYPAAPASTDAPTAAEGKGPESWLLQYNGAYPGFEDRGELVFTVAETAGSRPVPVQGVGPLSLNGPLVQADGRLVLNGTAASEKVQFIPRATLDNVVNQGSEVRGDAQLYFNGIFHPDARPVTLPLKDGATLQQGAARWRLSGPSTCKLTITAPKEGKRFRYSTESTGNLDLVYTAKVTPEKYAKDIVWTVPEFGAVTTGYEPGNKKGPTLKVGLSGLPPDNSGFGPKQVIASIRTKDCAASVQRTVKLFFPRDAKNNPSTYPNWFYYWSRTSARKGPMPGYAGGTCRCPNRTEPNPDTTGFFCDHRTSVLPKKYFICDLTKQGPKMPFELQIFKISAIPDKNNKPVGLTISSTYTPIEGIDTFGLTSRHENEHLTHLWRWWMHPNGQPRRFKDRPWDYDRDRIPDDVEKALTKQYQKKFGLSDPSFVGIFNYKKERSAVIEKDEEFYTRLVAHPGYVIGAFDHEDWAYPGKQWPK